MNFDKITNQLNALNYETNKNDFIKNYNAIFEAIKNVETFMNEDINAYENLTLDELMKTLNDIDDNNMNVDNIKKMKKLIDEIEKKINVLEYVNVE